MVSLFAFIHFCSLLSSVSANLSSWLKLFPDMKQFVNIYIQQFVNIYMQQAM